MQDIIPQDLINVMLEYLPKYMTIMVQSFEEMTEEELKEMVDNGAYECKSITDKYETLLTPEHLLLCNAYQGKMVPDDAIVTEEMVIAAIAGDTGAEYLMQLAERWENVRSKEIAEDCIIAEALVDKRAYRTVKELSPPDGDGVVYDNPHARGERFDYIYIVYSGHIWWKRVMINCPEWLRML